MKQLMLAFIMALMLIGAAGCYILDEDSDSNTTSASNGSTNEDDDYDDDGDDDDDDDYCDDDSYDNDHCDDDDDHYSLACPYPTASASASDTGNIDCECDSTYENESLNIYGEVSMSCLIANQREIVANSIPDHEPGEFPNAGNPNAIGAVGITMTMSLIPELASAIDDSQRVPAIARNGVKFEPETGETYTGNNEWRYEAIQEVYDLGLDESFAHVQPSGMYHYHGMPEGHIALTDRDGGDAMILVGWALDGFPVYARYGYTDANDASSAIKEMKGSYQLRDINELLAAGRPATTATDTRANNTVVESLPLGTFVQDWEYNAAISELDECNGREGVTPEFPEGIYHYYITDDYPYVQRCLRGGAGYYREDR